MDPNLVTINQWTALLGQLGLFLTGVAALFGVVALSFSRVQSRNDTRRLETEQRRISYQNLNITAQHDLTHTPNVPLPGTSTADGSPGPSASATDSKLTQYSIFRLNVKNIGDGPVDIWGCLVAARELKGGDHRSSWGGNIEWDDLEAYYYNDTETQEFAPLAGISNTRHSVYSQDDYVTLDPKEIDTLTRIDRIERITSYRTLLYRVFLVGRGHSAKEGHSVEDLLLWRDVQQALYNLSGPSFRILFEVKDPLAIVADRDGWQCFMLYYRAFTDSQRDYRGWTVIDELNNRLEGSWGASVSVEEGTEYCKKVLAPIYVKWKRHWAALNQAVAQCKTYHNGFAGLLENHWQPTVEGPPMDDKSNDLTLLKADKAFERLPDYLKWDATVYDSLPVWEKFFVVPMGPKAGQHQGDIATVLSDA